LHLLLARCLKDQVQVVLAVGYGITVNDDTTLLRIRVVHQLQQTIGQLWVLGWTCLSGVLVLGYKKRHAIG